MTPQPATLRVLLVLAQALGMTVAVGDCAQAFLQAPLLDKSDVWITPPPEAEVKLGRAWRLLKTLLGLKGGPAAWGHHATRVKEERARTSEHKWDVYCFCQCSDLICNNRWVSFWDTPRHQLFQVALP